MTNEPEPNGWELMRGIKDLRESVDKFAAGMVTQATFLIYQQAVRESSAREQQVQSETDLRQDREIQELKAELADARKTKAQQWFAIGLALLGVVGTVCAGVIVFNLNGGGR